MYRSLAMTATLIGLSLSSIGCVGRLISEGVGTVTGAAGRVIDIKEGASLAAYDNMTIESFTTYPGVRLPAEMPTLLRQDFAEAALKRGLKPAGNHGLKLSAEVIHYESGGVVDEAIGPLEEVIIRAKLMNAQTGDLLCEANLIGRSKATTSSGPKHLCAGAAKALSKWLKAHGLKKPDGEKDEE